MTTDVNLPAPRRPEQATEPAVAPAAAAASATATYPVPMNLTPGGLLAFRAAVAQFAVGLGAELEKMEVEILSRGGQPEHTRDAVDKARQDYLQRFRSDHVASDHKVQRDRSVLAAIMLTIATVGLGVTPNFLHSTWQRVLFVALIVIGVIGLVLTWAGRPTDRGRGRGADG